MKRKPLTRKQLRTLFECQGGMCAVKGCGVALFIGAKGQHINFIDEHLIPLGAGGTNALKNRALYCVPHAKHKTNKGRSGATVLGSDRHAIDKVDRIRASRRRKKRSRWPKGRKLQSRGFQKSADR